MSKSVKLWNVDIVGIHKGDPELTLLCLGPNLWCYVYLNQGTISTISTTSPELHLPQILQ